MSALVDIRRSTCLLCNRKLLPIVSGELAGLQKHPRVDRGRPVEDCLVDFTDAYGVVIDMTPACKEAVEEEGFSVEGMTTYPPVDKVLVEIFGALGLKRLGGQSSGRGWSSISLFQRCPYAWFRRYVEHAKPFMEGVESPALAIGTLVHVFLALYYTNMIDPTYPLDPTKVRDQLLEHANPKLIEEGWRLFRAYALFYQHESILPLAVEYDLRDPRNGESCRFDLIAFLPEDEPGSGTRRDGIMPGTWEIEHKTSGRFDAATLNGWANDGEVIGQVTLWNRLGLDKRFGPLRGAIINIIGKQKEPNFHRTMVSAPTWQTEQHTADLKSWEAQIQTAKAANSFPRARGNCIGRYGMCEHYDHCATVEA